MLSILRCPIVISLFHGLNNMQPKELPHYAKPYLFLMILLLEGFITISIEILTIRQLLPFFGGSVLVTSIIIGVFLLFLALGYWRGGIVQIDIFRQLSRNFGCALIWVGIGLSYFFITIFFYLSTLGAQMSILLSLSCYLLLILAPVVYWLGQTIPLTTNLFNQELGVSHISGRALFVSTLGSFLGAMLTSLFLFQYLGVAWTVVINCALLFFLVLYISFLFKPAIEREVGRESDSGFRGWMLYGLFMALVMIKLLNIDIERQVFLRTNNYANYEVLKQPDESKIFTINQAHSSLITTEKKGFAYIEVIRELLFNQLKMHNKRLLIIGAGGFSLTSNGTKGNEVTYVDIDPEIRSLAEKHFLDAKIQGSFVGEDARSYLRQSKTKFDVVVSDVYSHRNTVPASLLTVEYFKAIAQHLTDSGLLIVNMIHSPLFADDYARAVFNTIHAVFPYCTIIPVHWERPDALANLIYVCPKAGVSHDIYSDDLSRATWDLFKSKMV